MSFQVIIFTPSKGSGDKGRHQIQVIIILIYPSGLFPVLCTWKASPHPCEVGQYYYSPLIQLWKVRQRSSFPAGVSLRDGTERQEENFHFSPYFLSSPYKPPWRNKQRKGLQPPKFLTDSSTPTATPRAPFRIIKYTSTSERTATPKPSHDTKPAQ